jgi:hypothetical protein
VKLLLILGLAPALWAVDPAPVPEAVARAQTAFLRNDTQDYKTFDYLRDKLINSGIWAFATEPKYADILLVFAVENQILGTVTREHGAAVPLAGAVYGSGSTVTTNYVRSFAILRVEDLSGKPLMVFERERNRGWPGPRGTANSLTKQFEERFPKSRRR